MMTFGYRITAMTMDQSLTPGGRTVATFRAAPRALGSPNRRRRPERARFLIDFSGGDFSPTS